MVVADDVVASYGELLKQVKTNYLIFGRAMRTYQITVLEKHSHEMKTTKWIIPKVSLCSHILFKVAKERKNFDSKVSVLYCPIFTYI